MKPNHSTTTSDDDSDGEEEVLQTWKVTKSGGIIVVPEASAIKTNTPTAPKEVSQENPTYPSTLNQTPSPPTPVPQVLPATTVRRTVTPVAPVKRAAPKAAWFIGGNHVVKLLTSVDGDFDQNMLSNLASVPQVVGELALSIESLVSDDVTLGGFEDDVLAKIADNTIAAKRAETAKLQQQRLQQRHSSAKLSPAITKTPSPITIKTAPRLSTPSTPLSVPNPLATYEPVPNPLARITPPASPVTTTNSEISASKRKATPSTHDIPMRKTKMARCESVAAPMIQAM